MPLTVLSVAFPFAPVHAGTAGGAEQVLLALDRELCRAGHRSVVVAPEGSFVDGTLAAVPRPAGLIDDRVRERVWSAYRAAIGRAVERWQPDVVHLHGLDFVRYLPPEGVPVLATLHLPPAWYEAGVFAIARPDTWLHCVSESQREACPAAANLLPSIPNGVSPELYRRDIGKRNFALGLGRICPDKGFHLAFDAAQQAGTPFLLAGEVYNYEAHQRYFREQIVPRCRPERRFVGPAGLRRKRRLLSAARCVLIPSLAEETSSLVAMEAAACGTPAVAFRAGALRDIVCHGRTGFLVNDAREMAEAIPMCSRIDPEVCRETARTRFGEEQMAARYFRVYEWMKNRDHGSDRVA